jgi:segregation and condensation protein A
MAHEVRLDVFEGPIDLLLHLITRQRVDIYEVSIASITDEYLAALADLEDLDLESATGFLVVAATLVELKSARLLPTRGGDVEADGRLEERDLLLARLVESATYREAGAWIAAALERGEDLHGRSAPLEPELAALAPDPLARTGPEDIAAAAARALAPRPARPLDVSHIAPITVSVRATVTALARRLRMEGELSFEALCPPTEPRIQVVVTFLALLELCKADAVELRGGARGQDIGVRWTGTEGGELELEEIEEYAGATGEET